MDREGDDTRGDAGVGVEARPVLPQNRAPIQFGAILAGTSRHDPGQIGPAVA
jgi:hypothetical protein